MSNALSRYAVDFDGTNLTTFVFDGRLCIVARDLGDALGYAAGSFKKCLSTWSNELVQGTDIEVLKQEKLHRFKALHDVGEFYTPSRAPSVTVLYETGFDLVCLKTEKPAGKRLRRLLVEEVLPRLRRNEPILHANDAIAELTRTQAELIHTKAELARTQQQLAQLQDDFGPRIVALETRSLPPANETIVLTQHPIIGACIARTHILDSIKEIAHLQAKVIKQPKEFSRLRMKFDREVRRQVGFPVLRWDMLPSPKLGEALGVIDRMMDLAKYLANAASKMTQLKLIQH